MFYGVLNRQKQEIQDLKQALTISRLMTEHYRRLLASTYAELGIFKYNQKEIEYEQDRSVVSGTKCFTD